MRARWLVALATLALLIPLLGPALPRLGHAFLGVEDVDHYGTLWFYWFTRRGVLDGQPLLHTDLFFYPFGKDVLLDTGANMLDALLALPFRLLFGPILGYNLFILSSMVATAASFWWLAREFTRDRIAAGIGALLFTVTPYALYELAEGRPTQGILALLPAYLVLAWRSGARAGLRWPALAGLTLGLIGYQYWFYALFTGIITLALFPTLRNPAGGWLRAFGRFSLIAAVALALAAPVALPLVRAAGSGEAGGLLAAEEWSPTSIELVTENGEAVAVTTWQPLLRGAATWYEAQDGSDRMKISAELTSWAAIGLFLVWLWRPGPVRRGPVLAAGTAMTLIAMGPLLVIPGDAPSWWPEPLYIWLIRAVPVLRRLWWPARAYAWLTVLGGLVTVGVLASLGARSRRLQAAVALLITGLSGLHLWGAGLLPFPAWDSQVPAGYRCLADGPEGGLIELPYGYTQAHLYYQTIHGRPLLGGMAERNPLFEPLEMRELRDQNSWLAGLMAVTEEDGPPRPWTEADKQALRELGYRYLVLQKDAYTMRKGSSHAQDRDDMAAVTRRVRLRRMSRRIASLGGSPVYEDARTAIFAPWGDPPPCDTQAIQRDELPRMAPLFLEDMAPHE